MTLAGDARDFRAMTDEEYADLLNGRATIGGALEKVGQRRRAEAERIARRITSDMTGCDEGHGSPVGDLEASLDAGQITGADILAALKDAALAGMEAAR